MLLLFALILVWGYAAGIPAESGAGPGHSLPFAPGERLRYLLRWTIIPAGEAVLEVLPMATIDGVPVFHFRLTAETNSFADLFYKVRDRIDSYVNQDMTHAVRYEKKQHEGSTQRNVRVEFDWRNGAAHYRDEEQQKSIQLIPGTFDPLSVFYFSRTLDFSENEPLERPVTDGSKCIMGRARIIKRERIRVASGTYDTFLLVPEMKDIGGVFEQSRDAKIKLWVTADRRRIPVKIASKVAVGSFVGELTAIE